MEADEGGRIVEGMEAQSCDLVGCSDLPGLLAGEKRSGGVADVMGYDTNGESSLRRVRLRVGAFGLSISFDIGFSS